MKGSGKGLAGLLSLCMAFYIGSVSVHAAGTAPYTYTVTLHVGNHGSVKEGAGEAVRSSSNLGPDAVVDCGGDSVTVSGLSSADTVVFQAQELAAVPAGSKYYVSGVRLAGRDVSDPGSYAVTEDKEYVIVYSVSGTMAAYVVNYQDEAGNTLAESRTYYGNVGERPVVAFRYIEGYAPQAYNLTKTLSDNEAENVFTFVYSPVEGGGTPAGGSEGTGPAPGGTPAPEESPAPGEAGAAVQAQPGAAAPVPVPAAPAADAPAVPPGPGAAAAPAVPEPDDGPVEAPGDDMPVDVPDDNVPLDEGPQELVNLDDEEVPLVNVPDSQDGLLGRHTGLAAIAVGVTGAAALAGVFLWFWIRSRKKEER